METFIEFIGITLAILDFSGLSIKAEKFVDIQRERFRKYQNRLSVGGILVFQLQLLLPLVIFLTLSMILSFMVEELISYLWDIPNWLRVLVMFFTAIFGLIFFGIGSSYLIRFLLWALWALMHLINKPRAGTIGTIGLIFALITLVLK